MGKVLFLNMAWDAAGCSILQCKAINQHTNWQARHFRAVPTFGYDTDITPENYDRDEFQVLMGNMDVIEWCSADYTYNSKHDFGFNLWDVAKNKINIFHDYNSFPGHWQDRASVKDYWNRKDVHKFDAIFSSIPQAVYIYKDCVYIPDVVDERSSEYIPDEFRDFSEVRLGHWPTGGGNNKNTMELREAIKREPVNYDIPAGTISHADVLTAKRGVNIGFDALWRGFHGMTTIENMALGIPTMCNIDDFFWDVFWECFETDKKPFEDVKNIDGIAACLKKYRNDTESLRRRALEVRSFMENYWSFKNVAVRIVGEYEKI